MKSINTIWCTQGNCSFTVTQPLTYTILISKVTGRIFESVKVTDSDEIVEVVGGEDTAQEFLYYLAGASDAKASECLLNRRHSFTHNFRLNCVELWFFA